MQTIFKRYEIKYLISAAEREQILSAMEPHMRPDDYGLSTIRNIYYDTDHYRLIRRSIEKPVYKEKLRVRSYYLASHETPVFVELKKKYKSVVYKRRLILPEGVVTAAFEDNLPLPDRTQIGKEIDYVRRFYETLKPKVFLSYEREAYYACDDHEFRITFDHNILYRTDNLSLCTPPSGEKLLEDGYYLMEVKTAGGIPLWLTSVLTELRIFKTSFSKYGNAYTRILKQQGALSHV